jgi:hypothetical protein
MPCNITDRARVMPTRFLVVARERLDLGAGHTR